LVVALANCATPTRKMHPDVARWASQPDDSVLAPDGPTDVRPAPKPAPPAGLVALWVLLSVGFLVFSIGPVILIGVCAFPNSHCALGGPN
jgi:hypothetical protein